LWLSDTAVRGQRITFVALDYDRCGKRLAGPMGSILATTLLLVTWP
jgi:hypothetical protein